MMQYSEADDSREPLPIQATGREETVTGVLQERKLEKCT